MRDGPLKRFLVRSIGLSRSAAARLPGSRYLRLALLQSGKPNSTVFTCTRTLDHAPEYDRMKLDPDNSLWRDRYQETRTYFHKSGLGMALHFLRNSTPNTNYYRERMLAPFEGRCGTGADLKRAYEAAAFMYALRLMLRYHGYHIGRRAAQLLDRTRGMKPDRASVLDYGCGVADPSLFLALLGARATIVDLDDAKFRFAAWRFARRGLEPTAVAATDTEEPVPLDGRFHVIFLAEFLEHVRDPKRFLEHVLAHAHEDALVYDPLGPVHEHGIGGDHLAEARQAMERSGYEAFHRARLTPLDRETGSPDHAHFYKVGQP